MAPHTVQLRRRSFAKAVALAGYRSDYALAKAMGVNRSTVARVLSGALQPGATFIGSALTALEPMEFNDLFEVVPTAAGAVPDADEDPSRGATQ